MQRAGLDKRSCFDRSRQLLASEDPAALRYACLELRSCLEAITYDKLRAYAPRLPPEVLIKWQPKQAMAALVELEEDADKDYSFAVALETEFGKKPDVPFTVLGEHRSLKVKWLETAYYKLSSPLHVPNTNDPRGARKYDDPVALRAMLEEIVRDLEPAVECSFFATLARTVEFDCSLCHRKAVANSVSVRKRGEAVCLHLDCQATYSVRENEQGELLFTLSDQALPCGECGEETVFPARRLKEGAEFSCPKCKQKYRIVGRHWLVDVAETGPMSRAE